MANADFEQQSTRPSGGFSEGSYRPAEKQAAAPDRQLTPAQKTLAKLEQSLPAALRTRAVALALCAVFAVGSVFGMGGAKLKARYQTATNAYMLGVAEDVAASPDFTVAQQLNDRLNAAANILTAASGVLGADSAEVTAARAALSEFSAALKTGGLAAQYDANQQLGAAIDQVYNAMRQRAPESEKMGTLQNQYSAFNAAQRILGTLGYNAQAMEYNDLAGGFPANLIGALWGVSEVELFA